MRALAAKKNATYRWIVFSPQEEALDELQLLVASDAVKLPVGMAAPFSKRVALSNMSQETGEDALSCCHESFCRADRARSRHD